MLGYSGYYFHLLETQFVRTLPSHQNYFAQISLFLICFIMLQSECHCSLLKHIPSNIVTFIDGHQSLSLELFYYLFPKIIVLGQLFPVSLLGQSFTLTLLSHAKVCDSFYQRKFVKIVSTLWLFVAFNCGVIIIY